MTIPDAGFLMENGDSCLPVPPDEERRMVVELYQAAEANLKEGNVYYVLSSKWWLLWRKYASLDDRYRPIVEHSAQSQSTNGFLMIRSRPGPIDNSNLVLNGRDGGDEEPELRSGLLEGNDYVLVAQEIWKKLVEWYKGGPALPRKMISQGSHLNSLVVELYPLRLHLIDSNSAKDVVIRISKKASIRKLFDRVCILLKLDPKKVHIWDFFNKRKCKELTTFDQSLEEAQLQMDQHILVESDTDGSWHFGSGMDSTGNGLALVPVEPSRSPVSIAGGPSLSNGYTSTGNGRDLMQGSVSSSGLQDSEFGYDLLSSSSTKGDGIGGLTGLQNLGNTCFMNSALQCLSHTPPLVEYFLQDYGDEINTENPLGLKGELAVAFGELLRKLWSSGRMPVAPRAFKTKLARFAPQFSGYNQHDSQELLAFLLDGLHEDLNRVKSKPYIETKDANGRPDEEFADECWANHKARNDSIIVDVCQGQYKSTLVCPVCSKVSVTFDPFMYLSLPLPSTVTRSMTLTVLYGDGRGLPMPYTVNVLKCGTCKDLTHALSMACCLESGESLLIAEVYEHKIFRYLEDPSESLSEIKDDEHFVAYRLPANQRTLTRLEILHTQKQRYTTSQNGIGPQEFFGTPLVTCLPVSSLTSFNIQAAVCSILAPLLRVKINKENSCNGQSELGIDRVMDNRDACSSPLNDQLTLHCDMELDARSGWSSSLQLWVTDERYHNLTSIESFSFTRAGQLIRLVMDWSQKEHELYNASYLKDLPEVFKSGFTAKKTRQESISLFSCLEAFLKEEPLGPDDMWYCPSCKEHRQATKKLDLWRLPDILVFHLKRFSYSRYLKNKLETLVNFPIRNLDLSKYVKHKESSPQSHIYELYAVSNHYGGLGGGHYTAHAKLLEENRWFHFDDSHVSSASDDSVRTPAAYVLFYRRVRADSVMQEAGESSSKI